MQHPFPDHVYLDRSTKRNVPELWTGQHSHAILATAHYHATACGMQLLAAGGNAIDAAVAAAFALNVCEPAGSGLGGMSTMLIHHAASGKTIALPGACRPPQHADPQIVGKLPRKRGYHSIAIPTTPAVLGFALQRYGTKPLAEVLQPAIELALRGYPVTQLQHTLIQRFQRRLISQTGRAFYLDPQGKPWPVGTIYKHPVLAQTFFTLAKRGIEDFYQGSIADRIVKDIQAHQGFLNSKDLKEIPWPQVVSPLELKLDDETVYTLGPPGGGMALLSMLKFYKETMQALVLDLDSPTGAVELARIIQKARTERRQYYQSPLQGEDSASHREEDEETDQDETTQLCALDQDGNAISITQSLERNFGSKCASADLGFLYNCYLSTFNVEDSKHRHYLRPGATSRSNASPTIVLRGQQPTISIGAAGSERLVSAIFQVLLRLKHTAPFDAVHAPRLHCSPEGEVKLERPRFAATQMEALQTAGYTLTAFDAYAFEMAGLQLALREGEFFTGVADPRRDGAAGGAAF